MKTHSFIATWLAVLLATATTAQTAAPAPAALPAEERHIELFNTHTREIAKMGGKAVACNGDVAKPDFGDRIVKTAVDAFGDCHVVVNNAGYTWDSVIQKMSDEQWYAILDVHLTAPFRVLRAFQQHFRQAVEKERSEGKRIVRKVVNISSTSGVNGNAGQSNYSAGKAGIVGLTKTLAKEFGRYDVTVNAVAFGYIQTRLTQPLSAWVEQGKGLGTMLYIPLQAGAHGGCGLPFPLAWQRASRCSCSREDLGSRASNLRAHQSSPRLVTPASTRCSTAACRNGRCGRSCPEPAKPKICC